MTTFMHPAGPEPPAVYWIRRGAIVLVAVTAVVAVWWLIGSLRGGDSEAVADPETGTSASASPEAASSAAPSSTAQADPVECLDSAIKVEATTDSSTYPVGSTPVLTLTIINIGDVACNRDIGPKANELSITSGGYHVWSSDDCNASNKTKVVVLQPEKKATSSITWNGHLTQKGCPNGEGDAAKSGRYDLVGRNGKVLSDPTPFALTNAD